MDIIVISMGNLSNEVLRIYADALYLPRRETGGAAAKRFIAFCAEDCRGRGEYNEDA